MSIVIAYFIIGLSFTLGWIIEYYNNPGEVIESIKSSNLKDVVPLIFVIALIILVWPVLLTTKRKPKCN